MTEPQPNILVIDDDPHVVAFVEAHLADEATLRAAPDGKTGLAAAAETPPDLILLDLNLPDTDGLAVLRRLSEESAGVPVVLITAESDPYTAAQAIDAGAADYLTKPLSPLSLRSRVRSTLRRDGDRSKPDAPPVVLVIDDDPHVHNLLDFHLATVASRVIHTERPNDGLRLAADEQPDVILLDLDMPVMNGYQVCRELTTNKRTSHIPVLFLTADAEAMRQARALEAGATDYLVKPVAEIELQARIRAAHRGA